MNNLKKCVDLTLLGQGSGLQDFAELCDVARENQDVVRSLCVLPEPRILEFCMQNSPVPVCAVIDFPLGRSGQSIKLRQALEVARCDVDEIDTVMNLGLLKEGKIELVYDELNELASIFAGNVKVIIETGELVDEELIRHATRLTFNSGCFCVKTSTTVYGVISTEEKLKHALWMFDEIKLFDAIKHPPRSRVMLKIAGGIKTMAQAQMFLDAIPNERLIFGASKPFWKY